MKRFGFRRSSELYQKSCRYLAGGVSSQFRAAGKHTLSFTHGCGAYIYDVDGNRYTDFTLSQGPLILGHSHPELLERVIEEMRRGQLYAGQFEMELDLARRLTEILPGAELVRFCNSGSEAVHAALRLARGVTGRRRILKFEGHYHGWFDNVAVSIHPPLHESGPENAPRAVLWSAGQPGSTLDEVVVCGWNDLASVERAFERERDIAAIITEPIMCNTGCILPEAGYLEGLRSLCDRHGALLIFDEVITGLRLGLGGAQAHFGVTADLATYGKALAGGFPISVLAGKKRYMDYIADGRVLHAGTLNSNNTCVAAASATLDILSRDNGAAYRHLYSIGDRLARGLRELALRRSQSLLVQGPGPMFHAGFTDRASVRNYRESLSYDGARLSHFVTGMLERGIRLIGRGLWYISLAHTDADVTAALEAADEVFSEIQ